MATEDPRQTRWRRYYGALFDANATSFDAVHREADKIPYPDMRHRLHERFVAEPGFEFIQVIVADLPLGIATRRLVRHPGVAGSPDGPGIGAGERATQPGESSRYHLINFACPKPRCTRTEAVIFYDEQKIPSCKEHGEKMELRR